MSAKLMINKGAKREYKIRHVSVICQKLKKKNIVAILIWESMENLKMCNILTTADRRVKQMKNWNS